MRRFPRSLPVLFAALAVLPSCQKNESDDPLSRQTCTLLTIKDNKTPASVLTSVTLNSAGVPTSLTYDGATLTITYNANGLPTQVVASGGTYNETYVNAFDASNRLQLTTVTGASAGAGRTVAYTHDAEGRLTKIENAVVGSPNVTVSFRLEHDAKNVAKVYLLEPNKPEALALESATFSGTVPMASLRNVVLPVVANRLRSTVGFNLVPLLADLNSERLALTQKRYFLAKLEVTDTRTVTQNANGLTAQVVTETRNASNTVVGSAVQVVEYSCR